LVKLKRVVASPAKLGKNIVILLRRTFRTVFGVCEMLLREWGGAAKGRDEPTPSWRT
jgi:hypothetical protein